MNVVVAASSPGLSIVSLSWRLRDSSWLPVTIPLRSVRFPVSASPRLRACMPACLPACLAVVLSPTDGRTGGRPARRGVCMPTYSSFVFYPVRISVSRPRLHLFSVALMGSASVFSPSSSFSELSFSLLSDYGSLSLSRFLPSQLGSGGGGDLLEK